MDWDLNGDAPASTDGTEAGTDPIGESHDAGADPSNGDDAQDTGVLDTIEAELAEVEAALSRLDDGTYGSCDVCGRALDDERLDESPLARHCPDHLPLTLD